MAFTVVNSACEMCNAGCGILIHLSDERPVRVEGDPRDKVSEGVICARGAASLEFLDNPQRLKFPLRRTGARGEGKWQKISWDEAFETIASELNKAKNRFGAQSVAFVRGGAKGYQDTYISRFANLFGSPNIASMSSQCYMSRLYASNITYGFWAYPDWQYPPSLVLMWALNTRNTAIGESKRTNEAIRKGSKLIVIDPWQTEIAKRADIWVKPRPTSDLALALGMLNVIVNEELYDREFVEKWTIGFDDLRQHVQAYPVDRVSELTWVPSDLIRDIARQYAAVKPAIIAWGNGIDNNLNNFQTARALSILRAVTGNLGRPGGDVEWSPSGVVPKGDAVLNQQNALSNEMRNKRLNAKDSFMPFIFYSLPQIIVKSILTGEPYPVKAAFIQGGNILHSYPDSKDTLNALRNLDFLALSDFFMTPTAELADIVLPAATYLEYDSLHESEYMPAVNVIQKVAQVGECLSDYQILAGLARKMGFGEYFFEDVTVVLDSILNPVGLTFEEFRKVKSISGTRQYRRYENGGFNTPSKKVEIYSHRLAEWGFDPLPTYVEPPESPLSDPELAKEYPLVMTNSKLSQFQHSRERQIGSLRKFHPEPIMHIQRNTASKLGICEGDRVYIETKRGRIKQKANLVDNIDPRVVIVDYGWWFPEKDEDLHGWSEANINILTNNKPPFSREMGSAILRGMLCKVYKATE